MRKLFIGLFMFFTFGSYAFAATIDIPSGESKAISFPQELDSITFSKDTDISVKTLEKGKWRDVGNSVSNYKPLYGYIITNSRGEDLQISYTYKKNIGKNDVFLQRELSAGWNLVGVAQNTYNGEAINALLGFGGSLPFSNIVDFTDTKFGDTDRGTTIDILHIGDKSQGEDLSVFEGKAYVIFMNNDAMYSGIQNTTNAQGNISTATNSTAESDFVLTGVEVNSNSVVLYDGIKTALHKMKGFVGDNSSVTIKNITYTVSNKNTISNVSDIISVANLNIGGTVFAGSVGSDSITFSSIDAELAAGEANVEMLLYATLKEAADMEGETLAMNISSIEVEDVDGNEVTVDLTDAKEKLTWTSILGEASFDVTGVELNDSDIVLYNGVKTALHKMKGFVGDAQEVTIKSISYEVEDNNTISDVSDVIDEATMSIGTKVFTGAIASSNITFSSIDTEVAAGEANVEILLYATLKDATNMEGKTLAMNISSIEVEDAAGNELTIDLSDAKKNPTWTDIYTKGNLSINVTDSTTNIDENIIAGSTGVELAEVKIEASLEDVDVDEMKFTIAGSTDFSDTLDNVKLGTLVDGGKVTFDGTDTVITFEDFTIPKSSAEESYILVADIENYDTAGSSTRVNLGDIQVAGLTIDAKGDASREVLSDSNLTLVIDSNTPVVTIVPIQAIYTVTDTFASGTTAKIRFNIDEGLNDLNSEDIKVSSIAFKNVFSPNITAFEVTDKNENTVATLENLSNKVLTFTTPVLISNGEELQFNAVRTDSDQEVDIVIEKNGITFEADDAEIDGSFTTLNSSTDL